MEEISRRRRWRRGYPCSLQEVEKERQSVLARRETQTVTDRKMDRKKEEVPGDESWPLVGQEEQTDLCCLRDHWRLPERGTTVVSQSGTDAATAAVAGCCSGTRAGHPDWPGMSNGVQID